MPGNPVPGSPVPGSPVPVLVGPLLSVPLPGTGKGAELKDAEGKGVVPIGGMTGAVIVSVKGID